MKNFAKAGASSSQYLNFEEDMLNAKIGHMMSVTMHNKYYGGEITMIEKMNNGLVFTFFDEDTKVDIKVIIDAYLNVSVWIEDELLGRFTITTFYVESPSDRRVHDLIARGNYQQLYHNNYNHPLYLQQNVLHGYSHTITQQCCCKCHCHKQIKNFSKAGASGSEYLEFEYNLVDAKVGDRVVLAIDHKSYYGDISGIESASDGEGTIITFIDDKRQFEVQVTLDANNNVHAWNGDKHLGHFTITNVYVE